MTELTTIVAVAWGAGLSAAVGGIVAWRGAGKGAGSKSEITHGVIAFGGGILLAVALNHIVMTFSRQIGSVLGRFNLLGALVRLTGLIVMTIGTQMALDGISAWLAQPLP